MANDRGDQVWACKRMNLNMVASLALQSANKGGKAFLLHAFFHLSNLDDHTLPLAPLGFILHGIATNGFSNKVLISMNITYFIGLSDSPKSNKNTQYKMLASTQSYPLYSSLSRVQIREFGGVGR